MKKTLKVIGTVIGALILLIVLAIGGVYFGSKWLGASQEVDTPVYPPRYQWKFVAGFFDGKEVLHTDTLLLTTHNERFLLTQNKITWELKRSGNQYRSATGIVETNDRTWMHPPRFQLDSFSYQQYTEYSTFPEIRFPAKTDDSWSGSLSLGSFETEESGATVTQNYRIATVLRNEQDTTFYITSTGVSGYGTIKHNFIFNSVDGFTEMRYKKENGEKLIVELIEKYSLKEPE